MSWNPPLEYYTERGVDPPGLSFIPGEDFDPYDADDVAAVRLAMDIDVETRHQAEVRRLRATIADLRDRLAEVDPDYDDSVQLWEDRDV